MIHEEQMLSSEKQVYLGDTISSTGYNDENIRARCNIRQSTISEIQAMISEGNFGKYSIQTGLIYEILTLQAECFSTQKCGTRSQKCRLII